MVRYFYRITVCLDRQRCLWLKRTAQVRNTSVSQIIREAIDEYLNILKKK